MTTKATTPQPEPSPADVIAHRAGARVNHWRSRHVTREDFYAADEHIMEMYRYDEARATIAHEKLCQMYEAWKEFKANPTPAHRPIQPALL